MDMKAELRQMREQCPNVWERLKMCTCAVRMGFVENDCIDSEGCDDCWDKAIEEETK